MLFVVMLLKMCADQGDELQLYVHMPGTEGADEGGPEYRVCELWMQGMCLQ
jgi:hypothetical protein